MIVKHSGKVASVDNQSTANNAYIDQYDWVGQDNQKFMFIPLNNNTYAIVNKNSGKVASVDDQSTANNAHIDQYDWHGHNSQIWEPVDSGVANYYQIKSKHSGKVASVDKESTANNALIDQYDWHNSDSQRWYFEAVESFTLPSIETFPRPVVPQYEYLGQELPDHVDPVVTNYTLAPCIAVEDPHYINNPAQQIADNPYYLYVREQSWQKVTDTILAPGMTHKYTQTSGIKETDSQTVSKTVSHTFGADVGLSFKKDSLSAGMSYQYSEELNVQETKVNEELSVIEKQLDIVNNNSYEVSWTQYILVNKFYVVRADGTIVNDAWTVTDTNTTHAVYFPTTAGPGLLEAPSGH